MVFFIFFSAGEGFQRRTRISQVGTGGEHLDSPRTRKSIHHQSAFNGECHASADLTVSVRKTTDEIVVSARKGKKSFTLTFPG
jgi:hypothetical protein